MVLLMIVQIDILLSSLLETDKVSGDVMVPICYVMLSTPYLLLPLNMFMTVMLFKLLFSFVFGLLTHFFKVGFCLSHAL